MNAIIKDSHTQSTEEVIIPEKRAKVFLLLFLGVLMILLSIFLLYVGWTQNYEVETSMYSPRTLVIIGSVGSVLFSIFIVVTIIRVINPRPLVIINSLGIKTRVGASTIFVPWNQVKSIAITELEIPYFIPFPIPVTHTEEIVGIEINDCDTFKQTLTPMMKKYIDASLELHCPPVCISVNTCDLSNSELVDILNNYRQKIIS